MLRIEFSVEEDCRRPVGIEFSYQATMNAVSYDVKFNMTRPHGNGENIWQEYTSNRNFYIEGLSII